MENIHEVQQISHWRNRISTERSTDIIIIIMILCCRHGSYPASVVSAWTDMTGCCCELLTVAAHTSYTAYLITTGAENVALFMYK
jgi:hypothetical protein